MSTKKGQKTTNIRVFKEDWKMLKLLAKQEGRTLQNMFGVAVKIASKMHA